MFGGDSSKKGAAFRGRTRDAGFACTRALDEIEFGSLDALEPFTRSARAAAAARVRSRA
jgi:hypothetical protein